MVGAWWLLADLMSQVLVGNHGRVDGMVFGKQLAMAPVRLFVCTMGRRRRVLVGGNPSLSWAGDGDILDCHPLLEGVAVTSLCSPWATGENPWFFGTGRRWRFGVVIFLKTLPWSP
jgi:hypothetical protein